MLDIKTGQTVRWTDGTIHYTSKVVDTDFDLGVKVALGDNMTRWIDRMQVFKIIHNAPEQKG